MNLYPVNVNINEDISRSLLNHFDDTVGGDTELVDIEEYILVYNNYISTDAGIACCYNISDSLLKSEKIERIVVKISEERSLDIISDAEVIKDYINLCNEIDFYQLIYKLKNTFKEIANNQENCEYKDCSHINEKECYIKQLVNNGKILKTRYDNYKKFMNEIER